MARKKIENATDQRPFIMLYHDVIESSLIDLYEFMVFIALKKFSNDRNQCFPSLKKLEKVTRMSKRKIQDSLKSLEEKHIIEITGRTREDGGKSSNMYKLNDYKEIWKVESSEEVVNIIDEIEEKQMIEALAAKGYTVTKEKEPTSAPTKVTDVSTSENPFGIFKDTTKESKSQELERYTMVDIKMLYEYDNLISQYPEKQTDIDIVFDILYDTLNSTKQTIRIGGDDRPTLVVVGKLMKLEADDLIYSINKFHGQADRIKNVKGYLLTILYNAKEQQHLDIANLGHHNGDF